MKMPALRLGSALGKIGVLPLKGAVDDKLQDDNRGHIEDEETGRKSQVKSVRDGHGNSVLGTTINQARI